MQSGGSVPLVVMFGPLQQRLLCPVSSGGAGAGIELLELLAGQEFRLQQPCLLHPEHLSCFHLRQSSLLMARKLPLIGCHVKLHVLVDTKSQRRGVTPSLDFDACQMTRVTPG
jgi:hypothetical protein